MVSNNSLAPALQQRLQRAIVAAAEGRRSAVGTELSKPLPDRGTKPGSYALPGGEQLVIQAMAAQVSVVRGGLTYRAYRIGEGIRYVPGLDTYIAGSDGRLRWLNLYEDADATPSPS